MKDTSVRAQDNGRKRHIVVDTLGLLLLVVMVTAASVTDRLAGQQLLTAARERSFRLTLVWPDSGYTEMLVDFCAKVLRLVLQVVKRTDDTAGFKVLPRRWVVERTIGWLMRTRRLTRDYERRPDTSEAIVMWSMTILTSRRLARKPG
jgi:transposase